MSYALVLVALCLGGLIPSLVFMVLYVKNRTIVWKWTWGLVVDAWLLGTPLVVTLHTGRSLFLTIERFGSLERVSLTSLDTLFQLGLFLAADGIVWGLLWLYLYAPRVHLDMLSNTLDRILNETRTPDR